MAYKGEYGGFWGNVVGFIILAFFIVVIVTAIVIPLLPESEASKKRSRAKYLRELKKPKTAVQKLDKLELEEELFKIYKEEEEREFRGTSTTGYYKVDDY